jgi:hypothetical protein
MNIQVEVPKDIPQGGIVGMIVSVSDLKKILARLAEALPAELLGECLAEALKYEPAKRDLLIEYLSDSEE